MIAYERYVAAWRQSCAAHTAAGKCYTLVVAAIQCGKIVVGHVYGDWKVESIWAAGPQAWRPRPVREFTVMGLRGEPSTTQLDAVDVELQPPHDMLATYAKLYQFESDANSAETAAYNDLIAAFLRGEVGPGLVERNFIAAGTGYAEVKGSVRCYVLKPAVEAPKRRKA